MPQEATNSLSPRLPSTNLSPKTNSSHLMECRRMAKISPSTPSSKPRNTESSKPLPASPPSSIERDVELLHNRIEMLKMEETKALKKIEQTRKKARQAQQIKEDNERKYEFVILPQSHLLETEEATAISEKPLTESKPQVH